MKKYIPHAVIGIIAIIMGFTVTYWALKSSSKGSVPIRAELTISKPSGNMVIINEKKLTVAGKTSVGSGVMLDLKDSSGKAIFTPNAIKASKDGSFIAEVPFNDRGKYQLTVRTIDGKQSHTIAVTVIIGETPPYFVVNGWQRPNNGDTVELKDVNKIVVRDDDNDLSIVDSTSVQKGKEYKLPIPTLKPGEKRDIVAEDTTGMRFKIILSMPITVATNTAQSSTSTNQSVAEGKTNEPVTSVDQGTKQSTQTNQNVATGKTNEPTTSEKQNSKLTNVVDTPEEEEPPKPIDPNPPIFLINGEEVKGTIFVRADRPINILVKDDIKLTKIGSTSYDGKENTMPIPTSGMDPGTYDITAFDGINESSLKIIKYIPISLQIESPKSGSATSEGKIRISGKVNDGLGKKKVTINDRELSADNGIIDTDVSLSEGPNKISIFAKDEHDTSNTTTLTVNKYTKIALEVEYPENGLVTNADSMHVKGKVSNGWGKKTVMVNGKSSSADSGTFDVVIPLQDEGSNEINVSAKDERDTTQPESLEVIRDKTPPKFTSADGDMIEDDINDIIMVKGANGHNIAIEDDTGVKEVKLNGSPLKIEGNMRSLTVRVPDENLDEKKDNIITALDNAGNESSKPITVITDPHNIEKILKMVKESFSKNQYDEASKLLDVISKSKDPVPGMPLVNFYRGLISFKKGEKNRDFQKAAPDYETTVKFLKYSLPDIGNYPPGSLNAEYHRYYLGMAYYKRWLVLKQSPAPPGDKTKQAARNAQLASFLNDANDTLGLFINMVENNKTEAKIATMYNQAKNIVQEISKSRAGTE